MTVQLNLCARRENKPVFAPNRGLEVFAHDVTNFHWSSTCQKNLIHENQHLKPIISKGHSTAKNDVFYVSLNAFS